MNSMNTNDVWDLEEIPNWAKTVSCECHRQVHPPARWWWLPESEWGKELFRKTIRNLKTLGSRRGIANKIDNLKVRSEKVKELKSSYKLDDATCSASQHSAVDPRLSALFVEAAHLVGIDSPRDDLVNWMVEEENSSAKHHNHRVLSIVGFGGLGKTTLAKEVCHKIQGHFHCHAFVSVSQKPNVKKIMKDVFSQVHSEENFTKGIDAWTKRN